MATLTYIIAYDISSNTIRAKAAAVLGHHGLRIQRSVFCCTLEETQFTRLWDRLASMIDPESDGLAAFPQCETCRRHMLRRGQTIVTEQPLCWVV